MYPRLQTVIKVDLAHNSAVLQVTGSLTTTTYRALIPMIRRAHALPGHPVVTVDLTFARLIDPAATALLTTAYRALITTDTTQATPVRLTGAGTTGAGTSAGSTGDTGDMGRTGHLVPGTASAYSLAS